MNIDAVARGLSNISIPLIMLYSVLIAFTLVLAYSLAKDKVWYSK